MNNLFIFLFDSKSVSNLQLEICQFLIQPNNFEKSDFSAFLFDNINLLSYILIGYLLIFIITFILLPKVSHNSLKNRKLILTKILFFNYNQLRTLSSKIALIFLFFNLFIFILTNMLTNFIKTDAVIVNTDELIDTDDKLLKTTKIFAIDPKNANFFRGNQNQNSLLTKLVNQKIKEDKCLIINSSGIKKFNHIISKNELPSLFVFGGKHALLKLVSDILPLTKNQFAFKSKHSYYDSVLVIYLRKNLKATDKNFIHKRYAVYLEVMIIINNY